MDNMASPSTFSSATDTEKAIALAAVALAVACLALFVAVIK